MREILATLANQLQFWYVACIADLYNPCSMTTTSAKQSYSDVSFTSEYPTTVTEDLYILMVVIR